MRLPLMGGRRALLRRGVSLGRRHGTRGLKVFGEIDVREVKSREGRRFNLV